MKKQMGVEDTKGLKPYHPMDMRSVGWEEYKEWLKVNNLFQDLPEEYETNRFAHCKWKHRGFVGFVDDFGSFRYMPGSC